MTWFNKLNPSNIPLKNESVKMCKCGQLAAIHTVLKNNKEIRICAICKEFQTTMITFKPYEYTN